MFSLISFNPFIPSPGLAIWGLLIFGLFWIIISKVAFKPIAEALAKRDHDIQDAIDQAKKTREEMANMKSENEKLLAQAREERTKILQEAKEIKNQNLLSSRSIKRSTSSSFLSQLYLLE